MLDIALLREKNISAFAQTKTYKIPTASIGVGDSVGQWSRVSLRSTARNRFVLNRFISRIALLSVPLETVMFLYFVVKRASGSALAARSISSRTQRRDGSLPPSTRNLWAFLFRDFWMATEFLVRVRRFQNSVGFGWGLRAEREAICRSIWRLGSRNM